MQIYERTRRESIPIKRIAALLRGNAAVLFIQPTCSGLGYDWPIHASIWQKYGAEMAVSISGDDIKTISRYYADPTQPNIGAVRVVDLL